MAQQKNTARYRIQPFHIKDETSFVSHTHHCEVNGVKYEITAWIQTRPSDTSRCCIDYVGTIALYDGGPYEQLLATIDATGIDRGMLTEDFKAPQWVQSFLRTPADSTSDMLAHSAEEDEMTDLHKILRLLFNRHGRTHAHLKREYKEMLRTRLFHYIAAFRVEEKWRGKGLAEHALRAYLGCLSKFRDRGPVVLSPAPIATETERMQRAQKKIKTYEEISKSIKELYEKVDFEAVFEAGKREGGGITVMMRNMP